MATLLFERFRSVGSGKVVTLAGDGFLRQFPSDDANLNQHWIRLDPGTTRIGLRTTNQVIDAQGGQLVNNTALQVFPGTGNPNQLWRIEETGDGDNAFFIFADETQEAWDVENASPDDGALIQLFGLNRGGNQRWLLETIEEFEAFEIRSLVSNLVLDMPGFTQDDGVEIQQFNGNGGFNQLWQRIPTANGREKIRCVCSAKVMDYPLQAALDHQPGFISQYADNGGPNQEWFITPTGKKDGFGRDIVNIVSAVNEFFLDVPNGSPNAGQAIQAFPNNGGGRNQQWVFVEPG
jgi:hypothetical protein